MGVCLKERDTLRIELLKCLPGLERDAAFFQIAKPVLQGIAGDLQVDDCTDLP